MGLMEYGISFFALQKGESSRLKRAPEVGAAETKWAQTQRATTTSAPRGYGGWHMVMYSDVPGADDQGSAWECTRECETYRVSHSRGVGALGQGVRATA